MLHLTVFHSDTANSANALVTYQATNLVMPEHADRLRCKELLTGAEQRGNQRSRY